MCLKRSLFDLSFIGHGVFKLAVKAPYLALEEIRDRLAAQKKRMAAVRSIRRFDDRVR